MMLPSINLEALNVELTTDQTKLITQKLAPLVRLTSAAQTHFDIVVRQTKRGMLGERYALSVRMQADGEKYYAVAHTAYLPKALGSVRDDLRRSISKAYRVESLQSDTMQQFKAEQQLVRMFA